MEVAQYSGAEDGGDDDGSEQGEEDVKNGGGERAVQQLLAVARGDEVLRGYGEKAEQEPQHKVDVGG